MARHRPKKKKIQEAARNKKEGRNFVVIVAVVSLVLLIMLYIGFSANAG